MLLEICVGDAYGACFEWTEKWIITHKNNLKYITLEENPSLIKPGCYTDDTQMALAIAELMISDVDWTPYNVAKKFLECFHRDQRRGYAPGFYMFLLDTHTPEEFLLNIKPNSERSGAAMRAAPLGIIEDIEELKIKSDIQANITHNTEKGRDSALCAALMSHYFYHNLGKKEELIKWLKQFFTINLDDIKGLSHIPVEGWPCVLAAMQAILNSNSLSEVLKTSVNFAGDTDTIAAIAMGSASVCREIAQDLPANLVDELENGLYGRDYIIDLDKRLYSSSS